MEETSHRHTSASGGGEPAAGGSAGTFADGQAGASGGAAAPPAGLVRPAQRRLGERRRPRLAAAWSGKDVLRAAALVFGLYFALQLLWLLHPLILTGFIGLLFGLGVSRGADYLERVHVPRGISAALLVLGTYGALVGALAVAAPHLGKQFGELRQRLPEAVDRVDQWLAANRGSIWGQILEGAGAGGEAAPAAQPGPTAPAARSKSRRAGHSAARSAPAGRVEGSTATAAADKGKDAALAPAGGSGAAAPAAGANASGATASSGTPAGAATPGAPGAATPATLGAASGAPGGAASAGAAGAAASRSAAPGSAAAGPVATAAAAFVAAGAKPSALRVRLAHQLGAATSYLFPFLSSTLEVLVGLLLITFVAIFFSVDPELYRRGLLRLVPHPSRPRADEVITAIGVTLRRWLASQLIAMLLIGTLVWVALALLGVEAALSLGIIAGVFEFIPTVGSILAALPAIAMGFLVSPEKALTVAIVFILVQMVEGHLLIPMLMKRGMNLPPLLTILGQAAMAVVFGFLGLLVAVPVVATILTAVKMLYVNDVMGDEVQTDARS